jgi:hypothetical protein
MVYLNEKSAQSALPKTKEKVAPRAGFELATNRLTEGFQRNSAQSLATPKPPQTSKSSAFLRIIAIARIASKVALSPGFV